MLERDDAFLSKAEVRSKVETELRGNCQAPAQRNIPASIALGPFRNSAEYSSGAHPKLDAEQIAER